MGQKEDSISLSVPASVRRNNGIRRARAVCREEEEEGGGVGGGGIALVDRKGQNELSRGRR